MSGGEVSSLEACGEQHAGDSCSRAAANGKAAAAGWPDRRSRSGGGSSSGGPASASCFATPTHMRPSTPSSSGTRGGATGAAQAAQAVPMQPAGSDRIIMVADTGASADPKDLPTPKSESRFNLSEALIAELVYCTVGAGTILFNKHALSTFQFPAPNTLLLFQFSLAVLLLKVCNLVGVIHLEPIRWSGVKLWAPLNLVFVLMNVTGFLALQSIGAGMFTVLKNLSNLLTICGDWFLYRLQYGWQVWFCLMLMIMSAFVGGWSDLEFNLVGYTWQLVNCCFTAGYSLYLAAVIKKASAMMHDKRQLSELSMVYYNNLLSLPPLAVLVLASGELFLLPGLPALRNTEFLVTIVLGALMGFGVSFASIFCMARTSPTIYSLTGSLNKVVVALVGMWYFNEPTTTVNTVSIGMGLMAGLLFVFAKSSPIQRVAAAGGPPSARAGAPQPLKVPPQDDVEKVALLNHRQPTPPAVTPVANGREDSRKGV